MGQDDKLITLEILDRLKTQQADISHIREHLAIFVEKTNGLSARLDSQEQRMQPLTKAHHFVQVTTKILAVLATMAAVSMAFSKLAHADFPPRIGLRLNDASNVVRVWPHACSGFVIAKNRIMTAAHCVDAGQNGYITYPDGKKVAYKPLFWGLSGTSTDVAIVAAPTFNLSPIPLAMEEQYPEPAFFFSSREGAPTGFPSVLQGLDPDALGFGLGQVFPGDSGSAVINAKGELCGVVVMRSLDNAPHFWFVPLRPLQEILLKLVQSPNK